MARVSDRQLLAGGLLAFASGAGSANTRARSGVFGAAMSGNIVNLGLETTRGEWEAVGVLALVLACYLIGTAVGRGYLVLEQQPWTRRALGLVLALAFVGIDVLLVTAIPDATRTQRGLVASVVAIPLAALNEITKVRLGVGSVAMTSNLQDTVDLAWDRADAWWHHVMLSPLGHRAMLTPAEPMLFLLGALTGAAIQQAIDYSLTPLAPLFLLGLWASAPEQALPPPPRPPMPRPRPASTRTRFTLALDL